MYRYCVITYIAAALLFTGLLITEAPAQSVVHPEGELQTTSADDLRPRTEGHRYNEFWTYHIFLENDTQVYLSFTRANFGSFKSAVSGLRLSIINFDGKNFELAREYPQEYFSFSPEDNYRFQLRPEREIWFEGRLPDEQRIRVLTSKDGVEYDLDLQISNIVPGVRWGDGEFRYDGETIGIIMHIPYADIEGTIRLNDNEKAVRGSVYMDQTYQSTITPRILTSGFRYIRHTQDDWEIGYLLVPNVSRETENIIGYSIGLRNGEIELWKPQLLAIGDMTSFSNSGRAPDQLDADFNSYHSVSVKRIQDLERVSFLGELSRFSRRIVRSYLGGEVVEYRGKAEINGQPGYFNYFMIE
jgi:hypothetical protein